MKFEQFRTPSGHKEPSAPANDNEVPQPDAIILPVQRPERTTMVDPAKLTSLRSRLSELESDGHPFLKAELVAEARAKVTNFSRPVVVDQINRSTQESWDQRPHFYRALLSELESSSIDE